MSAVTPRAITVNDVTPEWLTEVLRRENALPSGKVITVKKESNSAFNSNVVHLNLTYSVAVNVPMPHRLLLKCSLKEAWAIRAGAREVAFYQMVKRLPDHPPVVVRCYDAVYDAATGDSHILLEDLSESYVVAVNRDRQINLIDNLPSELHLEQATDALARFHAYWWENSLLGTGIAQIGSWCSDEEHFAAEIQRRRRALDYLLAHESDWFPPHLKVLYETILHQMMYLWRTYMRPKLAAFSNLTLTHGDAYLANFLCPREEETGATYLIDWQSPEVYRGASDLVNMCATFWTREQRAESQRELKVLRQYHHTLQANGVRGYDWNELVTDYQLSIIDWLLIPLQDCLDGAGKAYWWPKMQCLAHAFEDWNCSDLFVQS